MCGETGVGAVGVAQYGNLGPLTGTDAALARQFYRFAADPTLGAAFADQVWVGIENGPASTNLSRADLTDLFQPDTWGSSVFTV